MEGTPVPTGAIRPSVVDPVSPAIEWTRRVLFAPFDLKKWFLLGFCAFLAQCGEGGGGSNLNLPTELFDDEIARGVPEWFRDNIALIVVIGLVLLLVGLAIAVLVVWLSSRGKFMLLDGVVLDRGLVSEPWEELAPQADSLFRLRLVILLVGFFLFALVASVAGVLLWSSLDSGDFGPGDIAVILLAGGAAVLLAIAFGIVRLGLVDFLVPLMYLRRCDAGTAWDELRPLLSAHTGTFVLYVLFRFLLSIVVAVIAVAVVLCTCCLAALPYIGTVIMLPLIVFIRTYPLYFLSQFGPQYARYSALGTDVDGVVEVFE